MEGCSGRNVMLYMFVAADVDGGAMVASPAGHSGDRAVTRYMQLHTDKCISWVRGLRVLPFALLPRGIGSYMPSSGGLISVSGGRVLFCKGACHG